MTEFRTRQEPSQEPETAPQAPKPLESDQLAGYEKKATEPLTPEEKKLDIWEGLNRRKFITEYFDIGNIDGEFNLKMQTSQIDKFIRGELERLGHEKNTENYEKVLSEIEEEIGSSRLELFKRITKLTGYVRVLNRLAKDRADKEMYINSTKTE